MQTFRKAAIVLTTARFSVAALLIIPSAFPRFAAAEDSAWTGGSGTQSWFNSSNWAPQAVPNSTTNVTIPSSAVVTSGVPIGSIPSAAHVLNVTNAGLIDGVRLHVHGNAITNSGEIRFTDVQGLGLEGLGIDGNEVRLTGGGTVSFGYYPGQHVFAFGGPRINGAGTLVNEDNLIHGGLTLTAPVINRGTIRADFVNPNGSYIFVAAPMINDGLLSAANGSSLEIYGAVTGAGSIVLEPDGRLEIHSNVSQPLVDALNGQARIVSGHVSVPRWLGDLNLLAGEFTPGDVPTVGVVSGTYRGHGTTQIDIDGALPGQFDQINVGGNADLRDGHLRIDVDDGVTIGQYDHFRIMNIAGSRIGSFDLTEGQSLGVHGGRELFVTFQADDSHGIEVFTGINPNAVPVATAGPSQSAFVSGVYGTLGTGATYTYASYEVRPGASATLALADTLVLTDGPLFIAPGGLLTASGIIDGDVINAGTIRIRALFSGTFRNTGEVFFESGDAPFSAPNGGFQNEKIGHFDEGTYVFGDGVFNGVNAVLDATAGADATMPSGGPVTFEFTEGATFANAGQVIVGDLRILGNFTQLATGTTIFELAGLEPRVGYSQLHVTGRVILEGQFFVEYLYGFLPDPGDTFDLVIAEKGILLNLPGWRGLSQEPGFRYDIVRVGFADVFRATFVGVPEPSTLGLITVGSLLLCGLRVRTGSRRT